MTKSFNKFKKNQGNFKKCKKCIKSFGINYYIEKAEENVVMTSFNQIYQTNKINLRLVIKSKSISI